MAFYRIVLDYSTKEPVSEKHLGDLTFHRLSPVLPAGNLKVRVFNACDLALMHVEMADRQAETAEEVAKVMKEMVKA